MRLRNKKTGEIGNLVLNINPNRESYSVLSTENGDTICGNLVVADYDTLTELNSSCRVIGNIHEPPKDFRPEHLKRMGVSICKGGEE